MDLARPDLQAPPPDAWQPLTFGGVAAFAGAPAGRLLLVAGLVALLVSGSVFRSALTVWSPTISTAIARLPAEGTIDDGRLVWPAGQAVALADNAFVSISVTPAGVPAVAQSADLQFEFRSTSLTVSSLLGSLDLDYPPGYALALNRTELEPLWGAWRPHLLAAVAGTTFIGLLLMWAILATLLAVPLRAYVLLVDRQSSLGGCWKLALTALLPGALIMGAAILGYSLRRVSLGELMLVNGLHLLVGTAYLLISPLLLPAKGLASPFSNPPSPEPSANPFAADSPDHTPPSPEHPTPEAADPAASDHPATKSQPFHPRGAPAPSSAPQDDTPFNPS